MIEVWENSIINRLKAKIENVHVQSFPDNPESFQHTHAKCTLLVQYKGSNYSVEQTFENDPVSQDRESRFAIYIITKNLSRLKGHYGNYTYLDEVKRALTGFKIHGNARMTPVEDSFLDNIKGTWWYAILFKFKTTSVGVYETEELPVLTKQTYKGPLGDTEVIKEEQV